MSSGGISQGPMRRGFPVWIFPVRVSLDPIMLCTFTSCVVLIAINWRKSWLHKGSGPIYITLRRIIFRNLSVG